VKVRDILSDLRLLSPSYSEVLLQLKSKALKRAGLTEDEVLRTIKEMANVMWQTELKSRLSIIAKECDLIPDPVEICAQAVTPCVGHQRNSRETMLCFRKNGDSLYYGNYS